MKRFRDIMPTLAVALLVVATLAAPAPGQEDGRRGGRRRGFDWQNMSEEQREQMRERFEQRREEVRREQTQRMREGLELTEEEYSAIEPMIDRVRQLSRQSLTAGRDRGRGGPGGPGRGGNPFGDDTENMSPQGQELRETSDALRETLRNEGASSDEIKDRLAALRKARVAMQDALRQAREELRGFVTPKQEATLVLQGVLD